MARAMARPVAAGLALALGTRQALAEAFVAESVALPAPDSLETHHMFYVHAPMDQPPPTVTFDLARSRRSANGKAIKGDEYIGMQAIVMPRRSLFEQVRKRKFCQSGRVVFEDSVDAVRYDIRGPEKSSPVTRELPRNGNSTVYVLAFSNCGNQTGIGGIDVKGHVSVRYEHGYLPAHDYPKRFFYAAMALCYIVAASIWAVASLRRWPTLFYVQRGLLVVSHAGLAQCLLFFFLYERANRTGFYNSSLGTATLFCYSWKLMYAFRVLIISSVSGDPTRKDDDADAAGYGLQGALFLYLLAEFNLRTVRMYRLSRNLQASSILLHAAPAALLSLGLFAWGSRELLKAAAAMQGPRPEVASALSWSRVLTGLSAVVGCAALAMEVLDPTTAEAAEAGTWWNHWFFADFCREAAFFVALLGAMGIWFPRDALQGYNYMPPEEDAFECETVGIKSSVIWTDDPDDEEMQQVDNFLEVEKKAPAAE